MTTTPILVTGGTGTLGSHVVPLLRRAGHEVRVLTRHTREATDGVSYVACDLLADEGIDAALDGARTVLHLAGSNKGDDVATRHLAAAARRTGVRHLVHISVIGADAIPLGYFRAKHAAEQAVAGSGVPWTVLRAAQFHDLALTVARAMAKLPVVPGPGGIRWEPVDAREVAARLVDLALAEPAGRVPDLAGPTVHRMDELVRSYLAATGRRRPVLPVRVPGRMGAAYRAGANLAPESADRGRLTWESFLAERVR
ncbi:NAD(P)H-binding protein [Kitasatospora paracochleata]|uniref:Uncharacterized protein YbjT (DUF2867 family) n=1 Tax=Kitasatospora paracochleata TaxID=58354 RepID=A0ABT1J6C2_9ACTN|nr:NAD(P)H-binding protein [Kitasatospora paracochleata]MCP2312984.1 uncharacterized protein YbjT (DUF2867 family) [Kitasatospora paracochleata]